jgi:hypothetical protein
MAIRVETTQPAGGDERSLDARAANDRIAEKAKRLQFLSRVPMLCECSADGCHKIVMVTLAEYDEIRGDPDAFLVAPGHQIEGSEPQRETARYAVRRRADRRLDNGNGDRRSA